jgi:hypothetical protein
MMASAQQEEDAKEEKDDDALVTTINIFIYISPFRISDSFFLSFILCFFM